MAAPVKGAVAAGGAGYQVARPEGRCGVCGQAIEPDQKLMAALRETPEGFVRSDCCLKCWEGFDRKDVLAFWQTVMPRAEQKVRVFVDDTVLCDLFERLATASEPTKLNFRFVLGLILMRKRLLIYDSSRNEAEREIWAMRLKGREDQLDMLNPRLGEEEVRQVSEQLGQILQQEL